MAGKRRLQGRVYNIYRCSLSKQTSPDWGSEWERVWVTHLSFACVEVIEFCSALSMLGSAWKRLDFCHGRIWKWLVEQSLCWIRPSGRTWINSRVGAVRSKTANQVLCGQKNRIARWRRWERVSWVDSVPFAPSRFFPEQKSSFNRCMQTEHAVKDAIKWVFAFCFASQPVNIEKDTEQKRVYIQNGPVCLFLQQQ